MLGNRARILTAIKKGRNNITINNIKIKLPTPQTHGTFTQQAMYADDKARHILQEMDID